MNVGVLGDERGIGRELAVAAVRVVGRPKIYRMTTDNQHALPEDVVELSRDGGLRR
jgi:hypothetical protein